MAPIPITIITGFLGSGKTTLILNTINQLPASYKLALLKNEFGDLAIDSKLAASSAISGVQELLNGCICCNLVGQLSEALGTLREEVAPDRIVIETSGSAFPATLAMEVNRIARETNQYTLDGVITVVDTENWKGYDDVSYTAKLQARYTDLIILSKWELVSEQRLEDCEDSILALEVDPPTPRVKSDRGWVDKDVIFGLDPKLSKLINDIGKPEHDHNHQSEVEVLSINLQSDHGGLIGIDLEKLMVLLSEPTKDEIYRIKAIITSSSTPISSGADIQKSTTLSEPALFLLNWAFGRWTFTPYNIDSSDPSAPKEAPLESVLRMTVITARYESSKWARKIEAGGYIALENDYQGTLCIERIA